MTYVDTSALPVKEPKPGWKGRFFHSERMTFSYYEIEAGADVHRHHHPQEEVFHVLDGELEVSIGDETRTVRPGEAAVVPSEVEHSARAVTDCRVIVADSPTRDSVGGVDIR